MNFEANLASFCNDIQSMVNGGHTYLEALTLYSEIHYLDTETISHMVKKNKAIMDNLAAECSENMLLKKKRKDTLKRFLT